MLKNAGSLLLESHCHCAVTAFTQELNEQLRYRNCVSLIVNLAVSYTTQFRQIFLQLLFKGTLYAY